MDLTLEPAPLADASRKPYSGFWCRTLDQDEAKADWIWEGFLAPGNVTLLTSQWKSGKTTLISILLARLREGGQLLGLPVAKGKAVVVSEEGRRLWRPRHQKLNLENAYVMCRPFAGKPGAEEWDDLISHIAGMRQEGVVLAVIDTLTTFLPCLSESNAVSVMRALLPLQRLTDVGMAVLLSAHPAKGVTLAGQAARGSGALAGFADIIVEKSWCTRGPDPKDRRRKLVSFSRFDATPPQCIIELNAEGTDYTTHADMEEDEFRRNWEYLYVVLQDAKDKRTRHELLADWPADFPKPASSTLYRWLARGAVLGLLLQEGTGRRADPFRYWLADKEAEWKQDPMYDFLKMMEENDKEVKADIERMMKTPGALGTAGMVRTS